jgi:hypothetical protein
MHRAMLQLRSTEELNARLEAERDNAPFLLYRDGEGRQQITQLREQRGEVIVGREPTVDVCLDWDSEVSRVHAILETRARGWTVIDDGFSKNGTFVNGAKIIGRRRLDDGDVLRCGSVVLHFADPREQIGVRTASAPGSSSYAITPVQRRVLIALCRPFSASPHGPPATNKAIAAELFVSVDAVKANLRRLAEVLDVEGLPQNQKRAQLAWKAFQTGLVRPRDLLDTADA